MNVTKLHNVTKQNSYKIAAGSSNLVTKLQFCLFLHSDITAGPNCIIWRLCHSPILFQYVVMTRLELADKLY